MTTYDPRAGAFGRCRTSTAPSARHRPEPHRRRRRDRNSAALAAFERRREIGLLRAAGASSRQVFRLFAAEVGSRPSPASPSASSRASRSARSSRRHLARGPCPPSLMPSALQVLAAVVAGLGAPLAGGLLPLRGARLPILDACDPIPSATSAGRPIAWSPPRLLIIARCASSAPTAARGARRRVLPARGRDGASGDHAVLIGLSRGALPLRRRRGAGRAHLARARTARR